MCELESQQTQIPAGGNGPSGTTRTTRPRPKEHRPGAGTANAGVRRGPATAGPTGVRGGRTGGGSHSHPEVQR